MRLLLLEALRPRQYTVTDHSCMYPVDRSRSLEQPHYFFKSCRTAIYLSYQRIAGCKYSAITLQTPYWEVWDLDEQR